MKTKGMIYVRRLDGRVWTPVVLLAGAAEARDVGVQYPNGIALTRVWRNPEAGQYTFCRGVYSFNPYDTDQKIILYAQWQIC